MKNNLGKRLALIMVIYYAANAYNMAARVKHCTSNDTVLQGEVSLKLLVKMKPISLRLRTRWQIVHINGPHLILRWQGSLVKA